MKSSAGRSGVLRHRVIALAVASCFVSGVVRANPTGPTVTSGSASFQSSGGVLQITNTPNAIINWRSFSIDRGEITRFIQQSPTSAVLNRVTGGNPSTILGTLQSNGRVFLINPNGILFGAGAQVNVSGLVASTLNISDADFTSGRLRFFAAEGAGNVTNQGTIRSNGGQIVLLAPNVTNSGVIHTPKGEVILAAGRSVELVDTQNPDLRVQITAPDNQVVNLGRIVAEAGRVSIYGTAIKNSGTISANSAVRGENGEILLRAKKDVTLEAESVITASGPSAGKITIQAEGGSARVGGRVEANATEAAGGTIAIQAQRDITVDAQAIITANGTSGGRVMLQSTQGTARVAGRLEARAVSAPSAAPAEPVLLNSLSSEVQGQGGSVHILGDQVALVDNAAVDASGPAGGGTILVGGDYQGSNPLIHNAKNTYLGPAASLNADATILGGGGKVIVWADSVTESHGTISARGGLEGGDGGFVETSGKGLLIITRSPEISARRRSYRGGTWLLDPFNITVTTADLNIVDSDATANADFRGTASNSTIAAATIQTVLNGGNNVILDTSGGGGDLGNITVSSAINKTAGTAATLTLKAHNDISINAGISSTSGALNLVLVPNQDTAGGGAASIASTVNLNGGTLTVSGSSSFNLSGTIQNATVLAPGGAALSSSSGTLSAVTIGSNLTTTSSTLTFENGLTLATGVTLSGATQWNFDNGGGTQSITTPGTATIARSGGTIVGATGGNGTLILGSGITLSGHTTIQNSNVATIVNNGTILANDGGAFNISTTAFTNAGTTILSGTGTLDISPTTFTNSGTTTVSGGTFTIGTSTSWTNTGQVTLSNGIWNVGGTITTAQLAGHFNRTGGTVNLTGTLNNTGTTVDIGNTGLFGTGGLGSFSGTINGGTLVAGGAALSSNGGRLSNVTIGSNLTTTSSTLTFENGLTLATGVTLSGATQWNFDNGGGTQSITTPGTATIARSGGTIVGATGGNGTLILGSGITLSGHTTIQNSNVATIVNNGTILANDGGAFNISTTAFTNAGTTILSGTGTLDISPTTFTNSGTTTVSGGTFTIGTSTSWTNTGQVTLSNGIWNVGGTITTAQLAGHFNRTGGTVNLTGTLNNTGTTVDIGNTGLFGTGGLGSFSGTINGGTLVAGGAALSSNGGRLSNVTIGSNLTTTSSTLTFENGLTLATGVTLSGATQWNFDNGGGTQSITTPGTATIARSGGTIVGATGGNGTLILGSGITLSGHTTIQNSNVATIVNNGTILANDGGAFNISTTAFTNAGTTILSGTGTLDISPTTFTNSGTTTVSGGTFTIGTSTSWTNTGQVTLSNGIWNVGGTITTAQLAGHFNRTGGTVNLTGTLNNTGTTVDIGNTGLFGTGGLGSFSGTINGGTLVAGGAALSSNGGRLSNVTIGSNLTTTSSTLTFENGLTLATGVTLSGATQWNFDNGGGTQSITTPGTATIARSGGTIVGATGGNGTLILGSGITLSGHTTIQNSNVATIVNNGTILANDGGAFNISTTAFTNAGTTILSGTGTLDISPTTFTNSGTTTVSGGTFTIGTSTSWTNTGQVTLSNGIWNVGGTITTAQLAGHFNRTGGTVNLTGTLNNTGTTVDIGNTGLFGTGGLGSFSGTINGGTLVAGGAALSSNGGRLSNVTIGSNLTTTSSTLTFENGLTLATGVTLSGATQWNFDNGGGTQSITTPGTATIARSGGTIVGATGGNGTLILGSGITLSGHTTIQNSNVATIVNNGTILANDGGAFNISTTAFTNAGTTILSGTGTLDISPTTFTNSGTTTVSGGTFTIGTSTSWTNTGQVTLSNGIWNVGGTITTAQLAGHFNRTGGTVNLTGTLNNTGTTVDIGNTGLFGTGGLGSFSGTINGGTLVAGGAALSSNGGRLSNVTIGSNLTTTSSTLTFENGLTLATGVTLSGATQWNFDNGGGTQSITTPGTATIARSGGTIVGATGGNGTLILGSGITLSGHTTIQNSNVATIVNNGTILANDGGAFNISTTAFTNNGTVQVANGSTFSTSSSTFPSNAGVIEIGAGSTFSTSGVAGTTLTNLSSGVIRGNGTLTLGGAGRALTNSGTINAGSSPGTLHITGDLVLTPTSVTNIEIQGTGLTAGTDYDLIAVTGAATLAGTLNVVHLGGFTPGAQTFQIMTYASRTGDFTTQNFPISGYTGNANATNYQLVFGTATTNTWALLTGGSWQIDGNWSRGHVPTALEDAIIPDLTGTQTITVSALAQNAHSVTSLENLTIGAGGVLTLATGGTSSTTAPLTIAGGTLTNDGVLTANTLILNSGTLNGNGSVAITNTYTRTGGTFSIVGNASINQAGVALNLANPITAAGLTLNAGGTIGINTGATLTLGNLIIGNAGGASLGGGTISNATVTNPGGPGLTVSSGTLSGVTLDTDITIPSNVTLTVNGGLTLANSHKVTIAPGPFNATLSFTGASQTLGGTGEVVFAGTGAATGLFDQSLTTGQTLTIGPNVLVHAQASGSNGQIRLFNGPLVNNGTISADVNLRSITINNGGPLTNAGTLMATGGGTLAVSPTSWTNSGTLVVGPGSSFSLDGSVTASQLAGRLVSTGGAFVINGTLTNGSNTFTVDATSGNIHLGSGGVISGGTVTSTGVAQMVIDAGTLSGVTLDTDITIPSNVTLTVNGGLTLANSHKVTIAPGPFNATLSFTGASQTLGGTGEVVFAGTGAATGLFDQSLTTGQTLTIGPNVLVHAQASGSNGQIRLFNGPLVNNGTISADVNLRSITINNGGPLTNAGTLIATNGGTLAVSPTSWTNSGTLVVGPGSSFSLDGSVTASQLAGRLVSTGGAFVINGTLTNGSNTFTVDATSGNIHLGSGGVISGGTVTSTGVAQMVIDAGTLSGVTLDTDITIPSNVTLTVNGGLTLANSHKVTIAPGPFNATLSFTGASQTLGGTGEVVFAGTGAATGLFDQSLTTGQTLTIGPNVLVHAQASGSNGQIRLFNGPLVNNGTISADVNLRSITINNGGPLTNAGTLIATNGGTLAVSPTSWTNSGTLMVGPSSSFSLDGSVTASQLAGRLVSTGGAFVINGTLTNGSNTFTVDATSGNIHLGSGGVISGGTVTSTGVAQMVIDAGTLSGVTLDTDITIPSNVTLTVNGGLTLANSHKVTIAPGPFNATLSFTGANQTLGGTGEVVFAGTGAATGLFDQGLTGGQTLTIGANVLVHAQASGSNGQIRLFNGPLVNNGTISADANLRSITINNGGPLTNAGTLMATGGGTLAVSPTSWTNSGTLVVGPGSSFSLDGSVTASQLTGRLVSTGGSFVINGTLTNGSNTFTVDATSGNIHLGSGGVISGGTVTSTGVAQMVIDAGTLSGVTLDTDITIPSNVTLTVNGGLTLANSHKVTIAPGPFNATLSFTGASQTLGGTGEVVFAGTGAATGLFDQSLTTGQTLTIGPNVLVHAQASGSNGQIRLFNGPLVNNGTISADVNLRSITINNGGPLTNAGTLMATGGGTLAVSPTSWTNSGTLVVGPGSSFSLDGSVTASQLTGRLVSTGGSFVINGTLTNGSNTFTVDATSGNIHLGSGGVISGGTVTSTGVAQMVIDAGTLSGVTLDTDITIPSNVTLTVNGGLTLANSHKVTIAPGPFNATLSFTGASQTLGGTGEVVFAGTGAATGLFDQSLTTGQTLTIGPNVLVHAQASGSNGQIRLFNGPLVNNGTISADVNLRSITINNGGPLTNAGTLMATGGGTLSTSSTTFPSNAGLIDIGAGSTFASSGTFTNAGAGVIRGVGTLNITGGRLVNNGTLRPGTSPGLMTITGDLTLGAASVTEFEMSGYTRGANPGYDAINVNGNVTFVMTGGGATARLIYVSPFTTTGTNVGDTFTAISATGAVTGSFTTVIPPTGPVGAEAFVAQSVSNTVFLQRGTAFTGVNVWSTDNPGNWATAGNWSAGVPVAGQTVIIDRGAANPIITVDSGTQFTGVLQSTEAIVVSGGTLTVSDNSTTSGTFTLSGGTLAGTGTLTLTGASNTWSSGNLGNLSVSTGKLVVGAGATLTVSGATARSIVNGFDIDNFGTVTATHSGNITVTNTPTTFVTNSGVWNANQTAIFGDEQSGGSFRFVNSPGATVNRAAAGTGTILNAANNGSLSVQAGTLQLDNRGAFTSTGTFSIDTGATLGFVNSSHTVSGAFVAGTGAGTLSLSSTTLNLGANLTIDDAVAVPSGATLNVNAGSTPTVSGAFTLSGGTLTGPGTLTLTGATNTWSSGTMSGTGATTIAGGANLAVNGVSTVAMSQRTLNNAGTVIWTNSATTNTGQGAVFNNSGTLDLRSDTAWSLNLGGANLTLNNTGTVTRTVGAGTMTLDSVFNNQAGTVTVNSGTLNLTGGGTDAAPFTANAGVLRFSGGTHDLNAGALVSGPGTVAVAGGTANFGGGYSPVATNISGGAANFNAASSTTNLTFSAGTLGGTNTLTVNGASTWSGGTMSGTGATTIAGGANLAVNGVSTIGMSQRTLNNAGTVIWTNSATTNTGQGAVFNNTGTLDLRSDTAWSLNLGGANLTLNNTGTVTRTVGAGTMTLDSVFNNQAGTVTVNSGTLNLTGGGTNAAPFTANAGVLRFSGGTHDLNAGALVSGPGTVAVAGGTANFGGGYSPVATNISGGAANFNAASSTTNLTFSAGTLGGGGTLTVNGASTWSGGTMSGTGATTIAGGANLAVNGVSTIGMSQRTLNNAGTVIWTNSATTNTGQGAVFNNTGTLDLRSDTAWSLNLGGANLTLNNTGTVTRTVGAGTMTLDSVFNNQAGTVTVNSGTLNLTGGGTNAAPFTANAGVLRFSGGTHDLNAGALVSGPGTVAVAGGTANFGGGYSPVATNISGGAANFNAASSTTNLTFSAGTLGGGGTLTVNGASTWSGGTMSGTGATTIAGGANLAVNGVSTIGMSQRTLNNAGTVIWTNSATTNTGQGAVFNNTGTLDLRSDTAWSLNLGGANLTLNNTGTVTRTVGTGTMTLDSVFNNQAGTVTVNSGTLSLNGGGTDAAPFTVNAGVLRFSAGTHDLNAGAAVSGAGTVAVTGGTANFGGGYSPVATNISGGAANFNAASSTTNLTFSAGTLGGTNTLTVNGASTWSGGTMSGTGATTIASGANLAVNGVSTVAMSQRTLNNAGTVIWTNSATTNTGQGAVFNNTGTLDLRSDTAWSLNLGGANLTLNNTGTVTRTVGTGTMTLDSVFNNQAGGFLDIRSGVLRLNNPGTNAGTIGGTTTLNLTGGSGTLVNNGTIAPGTAGTPTGTLTIQGNLTQGAGGNVNIQIGGTNAGEFDVLAVSGTHIMSNGTLNVSSLNGFGGPASNLALLTYGGNGGTQFATLNSTIPGLSATYGATSLTASINIGDNIWLPLVSGNWDIDTNWSLGHVPQSNENAIIPDVTGLITVTIPTTATLAQQAATLTSAENVTIAGQSLTLGGASTIGGALTISGGILTASGSLTTNGLNVSAGTLTGAGNVTVSGAFNWSGGTVSGGGSFTTAGASTLNGAVKTLAGRTWTNTGNATWTAGSISLAGGAVINNQGTFTASLASFTDDFLGTGTFNNQSGALFSANAGGFDVSFNGPAATNAGTMSIANGRLNFTTFDNTGTINLGGAGVFEAFTGSTVNLNAGSAVTGTGEVRVAGGQLNVNAPLTLVSTQLLSLQGGALSANANLSAHTLDLTAGTVNGGANLTVTSAFNQSGGTINIGGDASITQAAGVLGLTNNITAANVTLTSSAGATQSGGAITAGGLRVTGLGAFNLTGSNHVTTLAAALAGAGSLTYNDADGVNIGTVLATTGLDLGAAAGNTVTINAGGNIAFNAGSLTAPGGVTLVATGSLVNGPGGGTQIDTSSGAGPINLSAGAIGAPGAARIGINRGTGTLSATATAPGGGIYLNQTVGDLNGNFTTNLNLGNLELATTNGNIDLATNPWSMSGANNIGFSAGGNILVGNLNLALPTGVLSFSGSGSTQFTGGAATVTGAVAINMPASIVSGAIVDFNGPTSLQGLSLTGGALGGSGLITLNGASSWTGGAIAGSGTLAIGPTGSLSTGGVLTTARPITNQGAISVNSGTLTLTSFPVNAGALIIASGATLATGNNDLTSTGTISGNGTLQLVNLGTTGKTLTNDGIVSPGASPGTLSILGDYVQGPLGQLTLEVEGTSAGVQFDVLNISGNATLAGTLNVLPSGVAPPEGQTFDVIRAVARSGTFATVNVPVARPMSANYLANGVEVIAGEPPVADALPPVVQAVVTQNLQLATNQITNTTQAVQEAQNTTSEATAAAADDGKVGPADKKKEKPALCH